MYSSAADLHRHGQYRVLFSEAEDAHLINLVEQYGENDWETISRELKTRNARQCKERWMNYLSPNLSHAPWTVEEDKLLFNKVKKYGKKWKIVGKFFINRSRNCIKNRYNTIVRKSETLGIDACSLSGFLHAAGLVESKKKFNTQTISSQHDMTVASPIIMSPEVETIDPAKKYSIDALLVF